MNGAGANVEDACGHVPLFWRIFAVNGGLLAVIARC